MSQKHFQIAPTSFSKYCGLKACFGVKIQWVALQGKKFLFQLQLKEERNEFGNEIIET